MCVFALSLTTTKPEKKHRKRAFVVSNNQLSFFFVGGKELKNRMDEFECVTNERPNGILYRWRNENDTERFGSPQKKKNKKFQDEIWTFRLWFFVQFCGISNLENCLNLFWPTIHHRLPKRDYLIYTADIYRIEIFTTILIRESKFFSLPFSLTIIVSLIKNKSLTISGGEFIGFDAAAAVL